MADHVSGHWCTDGVLRFLAERDDERPGKPVTVAKAADACARSRHDVQRCLDVLRRRGLAERPGTGAYAITLAGRAALLEGVKIRSGPKGPHSGKRRARADSFQARLWKALRAARKATIPELVTLAARTADRNPVSNAQHYLRVLKAAGYVAKLDRREAGTAPTSNGYAKWLLVKDTGPLSPAWYMTNRTVRDRNTGKVMEI